jgi:hypothetical protein
MAVLTAIQQTDHAGKKFIGHVWRVSFLAARPLALAV